jgi:hypothetical protein
VSDFPYEEWDEATVKELYARITRLGPGKCKLQLRHYGEATLDGKGNGHLRLVGPDGTTAKETNGTDCTDFNESHIHPPWP